MSNAPSVPAASVIIPCRDSTRTLGLQLEALARQEDAPAFEVIIADNGSSDGLGEFVEAWHDRLTMTLVDASARPGAAFARNVGMSAASADKLLFCDSDDVVARDWVVLGCAALDAVEVFSGPGARIADEAVGTDLDDVWRRLDGELAAGAPVVPGDIVPWPIILGGNSGMRRSVAWTVQGYDASLPGDVEDNDLAFRLQDAGFAIAAAPGVRIVYRARAGVREAFQAARSRGAAHVRLCGRHEAESRSPVLADGRWRWEPARALGSGCRMLVRPRTRDLEGLASRAGLALGVYEGKWRRLLRRDLSTPMTGAGLEMQVPADVIDRPMLILSPHLDDALFSAAELIRRGRPDVWTVFAGQPDPPVTTDWDLSCGFSDSGEALAIRRDEDAQAFAGTEARIRQLDCLDGAYATPERRRRDLGTLADEVREWVAAHRGSRPIVVIPACAGVPVAMGSPALADRTGALTMRAERSILAPVVGMARSFKHRLYLRRRRTAQQRGLAVNNDHLAVRDVIGDALAAEPGVTLALMEDLPYLWWHPGDAAAAAAASRWNRTPISMWAAVDRDWKQDRIRHYASQVGVMDGDGRLLNAETLPVRERLWLFPPSA